MSAPRSCYACEEEIDTRFGVTVDPDGDWWHPDCRSVEIRAILKARAEEARKKPQPKAKPKALTGRKRTTVKRVPGPEDPPQPDPAPGPDDDEDEME